MVSFVRRYWIIVTLGALAVLAAGGYFAGWWSDSESTAQNGGAGSATTPHGLGDPPAGEFSAFKALSPNATVDEVSHWVAEKSVVRGTTPDGDWGLDAAGRVIPSRALRYRFDYYLLLLGQIPLPMITLQLESLAKKELSASNVAIVMDIWRRYLEVQNTGLNEERATIQRNIFTPDPDAKSRMKNLEVLQTLFADQSARRHRIMGSDWAAAFFDADDEQIASMLKRAYDRLVTGKEPEPEPDSSVVDPSTLDPVRAEAYKKVLATRAQWEKMLAETRTQLDVITKDTGLSEAQRKLAIDEILTKRYPDALDRERVRGLLYLD